MTKFIVREMESNEFVTCIIAENIEGVQDQLVNRGMVFDNYSISEAPEAPMFEENDDWLHDWNSTASRHHY